MDMKNAKVLGSSGRKVLLDWKRKQAAQSAKHATGADCNLVSHQVTLDEPSGRHCKRVRSGGCKNSCRCSFRKSVVKNYSNFMKSSLPQRVLFYQNGEWKDLPEDALYLLRGDFQAKKAMTEVAVKGQCQLFDFLHMVQIDTETGLQQPIAWIDESGSCFFPELYSDVCQFHPQSSSDRENNQCDINLNPNGIQKINVQLEIAISGDCILKSEEYDEASVSHAKRLKIEAKSASSDYEFKKDCSGNGKLDLELCEGVGENVPCPFSAAENYGFEFKHDKLDRLLTGGSDYNVIQNMFLASFAPSINVNDIVGIFCGSPTSILAQTRLQLFQKQVEFMKTCRGSANVCNAWFASSKESVSRIMFHRFEHTEMSKFKSTFGTGIHLIPANCSHISTDDFDVDENGVQHILLCRVIMGNMELIHPESDQFHPSNKNYDSGVDDLQNPKHYVIWDTHMNSHIYPEYIVSFRAPPRAKESSVVRESRTGMSGITHSTLLCSQMQRDSNPIVEGTALQESPTWEEFSWSTSGDMPAVQNSHRFSTSVKQCQEKAGGIGLGAPKMPSSPWMPFPMLLEAISSKIPCKDKKLVDHHYDEFKRKILSRVEFIKKLRSIVGDDLLRATIKNLQYKSSSISKCELAKKMW